jgi:hypothetical protein
LSDQRLQAYGEYIRDCDYENRGSYNLWDWMYIGRIGLGLIPTKFCKVIICFETRGWNVNRQLVRHTSVFFLKLLIIFILVKQNINIYLKNIIILLRMINMCTCSV